MKQTEHYQLNQWELPDRVQMQDFNNDNAKIDAALAGKLGAVQILEERTSQGTIIGSFSTRFGLDCSEWEYIALLVEFPKVEGVTATNVKFSIDERDVFATPAVILPNQSFLFLMRPGYDGTKETQGVVFGGGLTFARYGYPFSRANSYYIAGDNGRIADPSITIYGVK